MLIAGQERVETKEVRKRNKQGKCIYFRKREGSVVAG